MSGSASAAAPDPEGESNAQSQGVQPTPDRAAPPAPDRQEAASDRAAPPAPDRQEAASPPPAQGTDPHADFLITSADRDAAEARLRHAVTEEIISLDDFGDRMRAVLDARTRGDLQQAVAGLPAAAEPLRRTRERGTARPAREQGFIVAVMGGTETRGRWRPAPTTTALAIMGGTVIDLQGAEFDGDELTINALALMGGVEIIVPEGVEVELSGFAIMGGRDMRVHGPVLPDAPVVRVQGYALMGGIDIRHPKRKERMYADDERGAFADRVPLRATDYRGDLQTRARPSAVVDTLRRWAAGLLAAAALAVPLGWVLSADDVAGAVFGSTDLTVATQQLDAGDVMTVGAPVAFGSVAITVPEGVNVERDGIIIFGGSQCAACAEAAVADAPTVRVRTLGGFGSVEISRVGARDVDLD